MVWMGDRTHLGEMVVQPSSALLTVGGVVVAAVVAGHVFQDVVHLISRDVLEARLDELLLRQLGHVWDQ